MRSLLFTLVLAGCANDPVYVQCPAMAADPTCLPTLEAGMDDGAGGVVTEARSRLLLPLNEESPDDLAVREALAAELGVDVPYVKLGDIEVAVEWTIKNLDDVEGVALVELDGATEFFEYDPDQIVLDAEEDAPPTPGLSGNIPLHIPPQGSLSGLFREDEVREASIDCEQVTRANLNPFAATLTINKNAEVIQPIAPFDPADPEAERPPTGPAIPRAAFANLIRIDLVFTPTTHMVLEYTVRVRDVRGGMVADRLFEAPVEELQAFDIQPFAVMAPP